MQPSEYVLQARPPARAFLIAALACCISAGGVVWSLNSKWHIVVIVMFALIGAAGLALIGAAARSMKRSRVFVMFDDEGYRIQTIRGGWLGEWYDVTRVSESSKRGVITIHHSDEQVHLWFPDGTSNARVREIVEDLRRRLDNVNGYGR